MLQNLDNYKVFLASGSPRRHELLQMLGVPFEVMRGHDADEVYPSDLAPERVPEFLARLKAGAYRPFLPSDGLMITADTVVILGDEIIGKPSDEADACRMLRKLASHTHHVVTGVCITTATHSESFSCTTAVTFGPLTDDEITEYVRDFRPLDKAGAYGIQESIGAVAVERIDGSFYNVMGLPVNRLYRALQHIEPRE